MLVTELLRMMAELIFDSAVTRGRSFEQEMSHYFDQRYPAALGKQAAAR
jgi:hypothetical protein